MIQQSSLTLSDRDVRASATAKCEPHNLSFGKYEEHYESLNANGNYDDDSDSGELLLLLEGRGRQQGGGVHDSIT